MHWSGMRSRSRSGLACSPRWRPSWAGRALYAAMGGDGGSLDAALAYSNTIFAGAILIWLFNSLANVIRGTGNMLAAGGGRLRRARSY